MTQVDNSARESDVTNTVNFHAIKPIDLWFFHSNIFLINKVKPYKNTAYKFIKVQNMLKTYQGFKYKRKNFLSKIN